MGRLRSLLLPVVEKRLLVRAAAKSMPDLPRRRFISGGASLGALTLLTGCDITDSFSAEEMLKQVSKFNDAVQAAIFNPDAMAPTFPESAITKPFPFNAYYDIDEAPEVDGKSWKLEVRGLVENKKSWTLEELYALPQVKQVTRHICVEIGRASCRERGVDLGGRRIIKKKKKKKWRVMEEKKKKKKKK